MTLEEAKVYINSRPEVYLKKAKRDGYVCPLCNNGTGSTGDGIKIDPTDKTHTHLKCFKCGFYGDTLDLIGKAEGMDGDFLGTIKKAGEIYGIAIDNNERNYNAGDFTKKEAEKPMETPQKQPIKADFSDFITKAKENLNSDPNAIKYLYSRGLKEKTIEKYNLGVAIDKYNTPRIVIPYNKEGSYYICRDIKGTSKAKYTKPGRQEAGEEKAFYPEQLKGTEPIFIVEGAFCALSIMQEGFRSISLNTTGTPTATQNAIKRAKGTYKGTFILCLDNDEEKAGHRAGQEGQKKLAAFLQEEGFSYIEYNVAGAYKDPNDLYKEHPEELRKNLKKAYNKAKKPDNISDYMEEMFSTDIERFNQGGQKKTGFSKFDEATGGLYPGLYVLGALSSLGKTTFVYQIADQLAEQGEEVLFFSLEMSRLEMVSKGLSRETALLSLKKDNTLTHAISGLEIRKGTKSKTLEEAILSYRRKIEDRISIIEGNFGDLTARNIINEIGNYIARNQTKPVVMIDYLQILRGEQTNGNIKDEIDGIVTDLKRASRTYNIPIIVVSSFNRSNYLTPVSMESFKESGGIEYTADVLLGLQFTCLDEDLFNSTNKIKEKRERINRAKAESPRKITLKCLKNRYGKDFCTSFSYYAAFDLYTEEKDKYSEVWQNVKGKTPFDFSNAKTI